MVHGMILYHGSNLEIRTPSLAYSRSSLDFGAGFYLTTDLEQAEKWAHRITHVRQAGRPVISVFDTDDERWSKLSILRFDSADRAWLHTVVGYRTEQAAANGYDVITGPVADDRTVDVIHQYIAGAFPEEIALQLLLPLQFRDQWAMKTEAALSALVWRESTWP
ncbi:MAG: DUF3990 domain-containing protein [Rhodocyclaceae bacterium]|nr:DUF3990 domain-containing protein [Rhodocyclaceae bacterium]